MRLLAFMLCLTKPNEFVDFVFGVVDLASDLGLGPSHVTVVGDPGLPFPMITDDPVVQRLFKGLVEGKRSMLAESITLIESMHPRKQAQAQLLLSKMMEQAKTVTKETHKNISSFRIGLTGPPGAGKSTFIESFGKMLTEAGHKVAVLAVDPSSSRSGGSLLGDKTRMPELSRDMNAYIRPSPSCGTLGGVTRNTNDAIVLCEGAGFNIILVETMGVGQAEFAVADMVDMFVLLIPPAGGDELQGIKKGIVEVADLIAVNKSDGNLVMAAKIIESEYRSATRFIQPKNPYWRTKVKRISSRTKEGIPQLWKTMEEFRDLMMQNGELERRRKHQFLIWMWNYIQQHILQVFRSYPAVQAQLKDVEEKVSKGVMTAGYAADILMREFTKSS
ncbi:Methylmalonic aciduria type A protein, mitochondrial [Lamellibrachia satsuma]|nr:Methylmalonic aciduria type A protein, mitochondrial [Lamellibrachia satsuma]